METKPGDDSTPLNEGEKGHLGASDLERQLPVVSYRQHLLEWIDGNEVRSLSHHPTETGLSERLHQSCMALFEYLWTSFSSAPPPLRLGIKSSLHQDLSRLYLWGASFQSGWLDMILMESDELRDEVLQLLCDVGLVLTKKISPLASHGSEFPSELNEKVETLSDLILEAQSVINCHSDEQEDSDSSDLGLRAPDREREDYFSSQELTTYTECLMELCETMMRDGVRIVSTRIEDSGLVIATFRVSEPADLFVRHVGDKFPKADVNLVQRMGQANWERRERIREQMDVASKTDQVYVDEDAAIAQSVFKPTSLFHDSGLGSSIPASIASHRSFASSLASNAKGSLRVPDAPAEVALGKPFKCDFCGHRLLNTRTRVDWKRHVFADLQPYICTEPSCNDLKTFPTRKLWADHEFERHKVERFWRCQICYSEFPNLEGFQSHRRNEHTRITCVHAGASELTRPIPLKDMKCPLCLDFPVETRKAYETHVGAHLEDVALPCLPKDVESDDEEDSALSDPRSSKGLSKDQTCLSKGAERDDKEDSALSDPGSSKELSEDEAPNLDPDIRKEKVEIPPALQIGVYAKTGEEPVTKNRRLNSQQRRNTTLVRKIGACENCRKAKRRCECKLDLIGQIPLPKAVRSHPSKEMAAATVISNEEWDGQRENIMKLYAEQEWPLSQVIKKLRTKDFNLTSVSLPMSVAELDTDPAPPVRPKFGAKKWKVIKPHRQSRKKHSLGSEGKPTSKLKLQNYHDAAD